MLIDTQALNLQEVGEKSLDEIKRDCLAHFAHCLRELILDSFEENLCSTSNYRRLNNEFAEEIKYNSKNTVFESTIYNHERFSVQDTCADMFLLKRIEAPDTSNNYSYEFWRNPFEQKEECEAECASKERNIKRLLKFHQFFGIGEFPYLTIKVIRIGNIDHYFYTAHR